VRKAWLIGSASAATGRALSVLATIGRVSQPVQQPLSDQLQEIGAQLDWVRDYL
jgi:hypothetical protein